jgi:hypothetical protein
MPADYAEDTHEALVLFCARFLETMVWNRSIRMCRLSIAELERFPDGAARLHEACFGTAQERLAAFLRERLKLSGRAALGTAAELMGRVVYPRFTRALFGLDGLTAEWPDDDRLSAEIDLKPIRRAVADLVPKRSK